MKKVIVFLLAAALVGCNMDQQTAPDKTYVIQGYVRSMWCDNFECEVVFEHDTGAVQTMIFKRLPPLWQGEHAIVHYRHYSPDYPMVYAVDSVTRLK